MSCTMMVQVMRIYTIDFIVMIVSRMMYIFIVGTGGNRGLRPRSSQNRQCYNCGASGP